MNVFEAVTQIKNANAKLIFLTIAVREPITWTELLKIFPSHGILGRNIKNLLTNEFVCINKSKQYYLPPKFEALYSKLESNFPNAAEYRALQSNKPSEPTHSVADYIPELYNIENGIMSPAEALACFYDHLPEHLKPFEPSENNLFKSPYQPGARINATNAVSGFIKHLPTKQQKTFKANRKQLRKIFDEPGISPDLIDRIALMPLVLGVDYDTEVLQQWLQSCNEYVAEHPGNKAFACLATLVKEWYTMAGVKWTEVKLESEYEATEMFQHTISKQRKKLQDEVAACQPTLFDVADTLPDPVEILNRVCSHISVPAEADLPPMTDEYIRQARAQMSPYEIACFEKLTGKKWE